MGAYCYDHDGQGIHWSSVALSLEQRMSFGLEVSVNLVKKLLLWWLLEWLSIGSVLMDLFPEGCWYIVISLNQTQLKANRGIFFSFPVRQNYSFHLDFTMFCIAWREKIIWTKLTLTKCGGEVALYFLVHIYREGTPLKLRYVFKNLFFLSFIYCWH